MMYEGFDLTAFLMGLPLGMLVMGIIGFFAIRKGKKERKYDERYKKIHDGAKSISWITTYFVILLSWVFVLLYEAPALAFFTITLIYVIDGLSYCIIVTFLIINY